MAETQVSICIDLETGGRIGPGKIALLEAIRETGSITAAAIAMKMSCRRAWLQFHRQGGLIGPFLDQRLLPV
jgi:molybdate transport system regulatory protein